MKTKNNIKQLFFFIMFLTFSISTIQAQFSLGMSGGLNYNQKVREDSKALTNYYVGFRPTFQVSDQFHVGLGIQYATKSYDLAAADFPSFPVAIRYNYLDILPQIEYRPIKILGLMTGLNWGYPLSSQIRVDNGDWEAGIKVLNGFKYLDIGALIGCRVYIQQFYLTAHYNHRLNEDNNIVLTDANGEPLQQQSLRTFQIGIGYLVDL